MISVSYKLNFQFMKPLIILLLSGCVTSHINAQTVQDTLANGAIVIKDVRYDLLSAKKAEINKKAADAKKPTKGFRIQVLNTTDRNQALIAKSKLLSMYPDHKTYLMYQAPYFKLRIGNFEERKDADELKKELNRIFPTGVFVIPSEIEFKPEKEKEEPSN